MSLPHGAEHKVRVLHLEDDPDHSDLVKRQLARANVPFLYEWVSNREQYVSALRRKNYDLILADYRLPQIDGLQAFDIAAEGNPDVPFVLLSSGASPESIDRCLATGASAYLSKDNLNRLGPIVRQALRQSQHRKERERMQEEWTQFITLSRDCFCVLSPSGHFKRLSPAWERLTGFSAETLQSTPFTQFVHVEDRPTAEYEFRAAIEGAASCSFEARFACKDGAWLWLQFNAAPAPARSVIYATARDISARKAAQERVSEQAALLDVAQDAIALWDVNKKILYWNKAAERIYGWSMAETLGRNALEVLSGIDWPRAEGLLAQKGVWADELSQTARGGAKIIAEVSLSQIEDKSGKPKSYLYVARDITEKKDILDKFLRAQRVDTIGSMASGIAHDLNNIFTPILLASSLLQEIISDERQLRLLSTVKASGERGGELVKQILEITRGRPDTEAALQLDALIAETAAVLTETFPKNIRVETVVPSGLAPIRANATQVHQILLNLCVNARDAMPTGGLLRIQAANVVLGDRTGGRDCAPGAYVCLSIADSGTGMTDEVRKRIFDAFFTTKPLGEGTGLGLYSVQNIVREHRGHLELITEPGHGTEFRIFLPASAETAAQKRGAGILPGSEISQRKTAIAEGASGQTVLLVDDEHGILEMTGALLTQAGYHVITAPGGPQALAAFTDQNTAISLVIIDLIMPLLDGPATIRAFEKLHPNLPVIAMSGLADNQKLLRDLPGVRFLLKPFSPRQLLASAAEALNSR